MFGRRPRGPWLVPLILGITSQGLACPVCGVGRDGTAAAYLMTALLMCLVPLALFGAIAYYLMRRTKTALHQSREPGETSRRVRLTAERSAQA